MFLHIQGLSDSPSIQTIGVTDESDGRTLEVIGTNFGDSKPVVKAGGALCDVSEFSSSRIVCYLPSGGPAGEHKINVLIPGVGLAIHQGTEI